MAKDDDLKLDQLLAGGRLSGRQYDEIERRVLQRVAPSPARRFWPAWGGAAVLASALGAWLLIARGSLPLSGTDGARPSDGFTAKGTATAGTPGPVFDVACDSATRTCHVGDTLLVSVTGGLASGYVAAYAEREDTSPSERIWYFPDLAGVSPHIEASTGSVVLPRGVRLGPPHAPGRYRVTLWLAASPPQRAAPVPAPGTSPAVLALEILE